MPEHITEVDTNPNNYGDGGEVEDLWVEKKVWTW